MKIENKLVEMPPRYLPQPVIRFRGKGFEKFLKTPETRKAFWNLKGKQFGTVLGKDMKLCIIRIEGDRLTPGLTAMQTFARHLTTALQAYGFTTKGAAQIEPGALPRDVDPLQSAEKGHRGSQCGSHQIEHP